jgi:PmbA protein
MTPIDYARHMVELARRAGAEQCDVYVRAYDESEVTVRLGETEKLVEAGSKSLGLRVINGGRTAVCSTADLREESLARLAKETVELALISAPDEYAGLPSADDLARPGGDSLQLYDERPAASQRTKVRMAKACGLPHSASTRASRTPRGHRDGRSGEVALATRSASRRRIRPRRLR